MEYGSEDSLDFTNIYFMLLNYWTLVESNNIARERKQVFHNFENQLMLTALISKIRNWRIPAKIRKVKALFEGILSQLLKIGML